MAILPGSNSRAYLDIEADVGISVSMPLFTADVITVFYGNVGLTATLNLDYEITLNEVDFSDFVLTPLDLLIDKIDALIAADPAEYNTIYVIRTLPLSTNSTPASARSSDFVSREFDQITMKLQQLQGNLASAPELIELTARAEVAADAAEFSEAAAVAAATLVSSIAQPRFSTVAAMIADATMGYSGSSLYPVAAGNVLWAASYTYKVAAAGASDHHLITAGGVKLYVTPVLPGLGGGYSFAAMNPAADGVTDDYPKLAKLLAVAPTGTGFYRTTPAIYFPNGSYYMGQTIELKRSTKLYGDSSGMATDAAATLIFPADTTAVVINRYNTINGGVEGSPTTAADGTIVEGLRFKSTRGTDITKRAIWMRARATIRNVAIDGFTGGGVDIIAAGGAGGALEGNANCFVIDTMRIINCEYGVYVQGSDANAGHGSNIDASSNRRWGIFDNSFLGNTWSGCHVSDNGVDATLGRSAYASFGGNTYHAVPGVSSATLGSTQPGTDATKWRKCSATGYSIAWTGSNPANTYRDGGGYRSDNVNARVLFEGCYAEAGQGLTWLSPQSIAIGGFLVECPVAEGAGGNIEGRFGMNFSKTGFWSGGVDPTGVKKADAYLGGNALNGDILRFEGDEGGGVVTGTWRLKRNGAGWTWNYANLTDVLGFTGTTDTYPTMPQMATMVLGRGGTSRLFGRVNYSTSNGIVLPSSGTYAKGDILFAPNPTAGDFIGFVCTAGGIAGSTAVFKTFGAISA